MNITKNFKRSLVIGFVCILLMQSFIPASALKENQSWFFTGSIADEKEQDEHSGITVINDEDTDLEIHFGIFDAIMKIFD